MLHIYLFYLDIQRHIRGYEGSVYILVTMNLLKIFCFSTYEKKNADVMLRKLSIRRKKSKVSFILVYSILPVLFIWLFYEMGILQYLFTRYIL